MDNISYIIPHYESVEFLKVLLDSIECSEDDEILIIDDNSRSEVVKQLETLTTNQNIHLLKQSKNLGAGAARNLGIQNARKEWLIFADSDDFFIDDYKKEVDKYLNSELDVVYFTPTSEKKSNNLSVRGDRHSYYEFLINNYLENRNNKNKNLMKFQMVVPWSKMIRRNFVINNNILYDEVMVSNDVMFSTKIGFLSQKSEATNNKIYCCVEHSESLTSDITFKKTMNRLEIFKNQYNYLNENLEKNEFRALNMTGISFFIQSIKQKYTLSQKKEMLSFLKKNNIKIFNVKWIKNIIIRSIKTN